MPAPIYVFDAYGTLLDVHAAIARHRQSEGWVVQSLRDRFGREGIARLGRLGFDLALAPDAQPFRRLRELAAALEKQPLSD